MIEEGTATVRGIVDRCLAAVARVRRPEYTGRNRCAACTVVNVAIGIVLGLVIWAVSGVPLAGGATVALALVAIYLRGYLVPGTPTLTKRYLPDRVLRWFEAGSPRGPPGVPAAFDSVAFLESNDVVVDDPAAHDVFLEPSFEGSWADRMASMHHRAMDLSSLASLLDVDADALELEAHGPAVVARYDGRWIGQWESRAAFVADMAASAELAASIPDWPSIPLDHRSEVLGTLRLLLDSCPICDGRVEVGIEAVESCCRSYDVVASTCAGCAARLVELEYDPARFGRAE